MSWDQNRIDALGALIASRALPDVAMAAKAAHEIELAALAAEHYGRPKSDIPALIAFERHRAEQAAIPGMPGLSALPCYVAGFHAGRAAAPAWSADAPTEQDWYWHWNGDPDAAPFPLSVLWSGTAKKCFVADQTGRGQAEWCDKYGGYWLRMEQPPLPDPVPTKSKRKTA